MKKRTLSLLFTLFCCSYSFGQMKVKTEDGREILIHENGTWETVPEKKTPTGIAFLKIEGWAWDENPIRRPIKGNGKAIYQITITDQGYVFKVETLYSSFNSETTHFYKDRIGKTQFISLTNDNCKSLTTGTITVNIN